MDVKQRLWAIKVICALKTTSALVLIAYGAAVQAREYVIAYDDYLAASKGQPVAIDVLANDFSDDDLPLTIHNIMLISGQAELALQPDNTILVTPPADFDGRIEFIYYVQNFIGHVASAIAVVDYSPPKTALSPDVIAAMASTFAALNQVNSLAVGNHQRVISQVLQMNAQPTGSFVYRKQAPLGAGAGDDLLPLGGVFVSINATRIDTTARNNTAASKTDLQSLTAGIDVNLGEQWVVGAALGASTAELKSAHNDVAALDFDELSLVGFAAYRFQNWLSIGAFGHSKSAIVSEDVDAHQQFDIDGSHNFALAKFQYSYNHNAWRLQPGLEVRYQQAMTDAFSDASATESMSYSDQGLDQTLATLNLQASYVFNMSYGVLSPQITLAREYCLDTSFDAVVVTSNNQSFALERNFMTDDQPLLLDLGLVVVLPLGFSGFINYHQLFDQRTYGVKSVQLGGRWEF